MSPRPATQEPAKPSFAGRLLVRGPQVAERWAALHYLRLRYGHASFGDHCDVRRGAHFTVRDGGTISFGDSCILDRDMTVEVTGRLEVGRRTIFGHHCTLAARSLVSIGACCLIAEMVSIRDHDHDFSRLDVPTVDQGATVSDVVIGYNVWLGSKVTVLKGVTIGDNAIVGAGAVVSRDVPANAIAAGVPARVLRYR